MFSMLISPVCSSLENKPLDQTALRGVKNILVEGGSRSLAHHLTRADLELLHGGAPGEDLGLGMRSGIELATLPHGAQLRQDLIERSECVKLLVAATVLMGNEGPEERAQLIQRWVQLAVDTKTAMGNLYGFTNIMLGLMVPEVQRLQATWHTLRQRHTDSAFTYESKLRSCLKAMNECSNDLAPNTTIPHLLPFLLLCERDMDDIYASHTKGSSLLQWESTESDYGLSIIVKHLEEARAFGSSLALFQRNAEHLLADETIALEDLTLDTFRTEFHLKFLWGSRGAAAVAHERHAKFQSVLQTLSELCEPSKT